MSKIELIGYVNDKGQLEFTFELPAGFPPGEVRIVVEPLSPKSHEPRKPGSAKGQIVVSDDFDEPLDDFREYTDSSVLSNDEWLAQVKQSREETLAKYGKDFTINTQEIRDEVRKGRLNDLLGSS